MSSGYKEEEQAASPAAEPVTKTQAAEPVKKKKKMLNILIIRHGESEQNVMVDQSLQLDSQDDVIKQALEEIFQGSTEGSTEAFDKLLSRIMEPSLTSLGFAQADRLAGYAGPLADDVGENGKVCMFVSPHLRTCQTAQPLYAALKAKNFVTTEIREDIFEPPGIPKTKMPADLPEAGLTFQEQVGKFYKAWNAVPDEQSEANGQNVSQIEKQFGYDTSKMKNRSEQGWCSLKKFETEDDWNRRTQGVIDWLLSRDLYEQCAKKAPNGTPWVVLVAHAHTNSLLIQKLLGAPREVFYGQDNTNVTHFCISHEKEGKAPHITLCSLNQVEHLWTIPHSFGATPLPLNYQTGKSGAWNNYGRRA